MAQQFLVSGGLQGFCNPAADETTVQERFERRFATEALALAFARDMVRRLKPGGAVHVSREDTEVDPWSMEGFGPGNEIATCTLMPPPLPGEEDLATGERWYVSGIDLRTV